ncbi:OpcA protein, partial [Streptomyces sp. NRRL F-6602]
PKRAVALKRRETAELIAEELRRLDPDDTYAAALRYGVERLDEHEVPRVADAPDAPHRAEGHKDAPVKRTTKATAAKKGAK